MGRSGRLLLAALLGCVAVAAVAALAVLGLSSAGSESSERVAPALPSQSLSGPLVTIAGLLGADGSRSLAVVFWASWCEPCEHEAPALERFARSAAGARRMVGVDWNDPGLGEARSFIRRFHWTFPNLRDPQGLAGDAYRITGLPTTFIVDRSGRIAAVLRGPQNESSLEHALARAEGS